MKLAGPDQKSEEYWAEMRAKHGNDDLRIRTLFQTARDLHKSYHDVNITPPVLGLMQGPSDRAWRQRPALSGRIRDLAVRSDQRCAFMDHAKQGPLSRLWTRCEIFPIYRTGVLAMRMNIFSQTANPQKPDVLLDYLTHPQVAVDPRKNVQCWPLNDTDQAWIEALAASKTLQGTTRIISSCETKAFATIWSARCLSRPNVFSARPC